MGSTRARLPAPVGILQDKFGSPMLVGNDAGYDDDDDDNDDSD